MKTRIPALLTLTYTLSAGDAAAAARTADVILADAKAKVIQISKDLLVTTTADADAKIRRADEHLDEVKNLLEEYYRAPPNPATAPTAAQWAEYRKRLDATIETMKALQKATSETQARTTKLISECTAAESVLSDKIQAAITAQDPSAITVLADQAERVEALVDPKLDDLLADLKQTEQLRNVVTQFNASGVWDAVENNIEAAAQALVEANIRARKAVFASCEQLALGDAHKRIVEAVKTLRQLQTDTFKDFPQLREGTNRFFDSVAALRKWHEHEIEKFRLALCDIDEQEHNGGLETEVLAELGRRITDEMKRRENEIVGAADRIIAAIKGKKSGLTKSDRDTLDAIVKDIDRVKKQVTLAVNGSPWAKGSNNPRIRLSLEVGKQEHLQYQRNSSYCTAAEVVLPNSRRIDCVKVDGNRCTIVELKPDTRRAFNKGTEQVTKYQKAIKDLWNGGKGKSSFNSNGLQVFLRCQQDTQLNLNVPQVQMYKVCPEPGMLSGDLLPAIQIPPGTKNLWSKIKPAP